MVQGGVLYLKNVQFDDTISILVECIESSCVKECTGQRLVTGLLYFHCCNLSFSFFVVPKFELRASHLLGSTT
jgi:hypothetical protein